MATSNNPNARYDAGPNAAGCGRVATQAQLQAEAETGLLGDSTLSGAAFRVGFAAAGIRNVNTGGNVAGAPEAPRVPVSSVPVVEFTYEPDTATVTWTDTNGAGQSGDLATFNATADFATVSAISLSYQGLTSLTVGNQFPVLASLDISYNSGLATDLDFTGLTSLTYLNCGYCALTSINVVGMSSLVTLLAFYNPITELDLTGLTSLQTLNVDSTASLTSIDLSKVPGLKSFGCYYGGLTSLDLSAVPVLTSLAISYTSLSSPPDYTQVPLLTTLGVSGIGYLPDLTLFPALETLMTANNGLSALDVSMLPNLIHLDCNFNSITTLDVAGMTNLAHVLCANNSMTALTLTGCTGLLEVLGSGNSIGSVDIDSSALLENFSVVGSGMNTINVDYILSTINGFGTSGPGKSIGLTGNSAPTGGFSNADKLALEGRGWTIYI